MSAEARVEIVGLKEALRALNKIDRSMRLQVTKDYKEIVAPVVADIKSEIPLKPPMSGWAYQFKGNSGANVLPWKGNERAMVKPYISGKKPKSFGGFTSNLGVFGIRWNAPAATMFDMSHTSHSEHGTSMIQTLNMRYGSNKSRVMYKNWERHQAMVERGMENLVKRIMERVQKEL